ncbi:sigma factor-like helix-turn-helix DNA-binding protein [Solibacillus sp. NPDC093137]|uniref:sigma factor-like helix-turn-helix DNA-binding protein n=1 Tax=Solibacillus sp. NPDC093137 TaxID=3390678 RepID=UPI003D00CE22
MNKWNEEKIRQFETENSEFLKNNLVVSFLNTSQNKEVYLETISNPTPENMKKLDILFKDFYFNIRFVSHISTTLKFNSINYDKRAKLIQARFLTTLDAAINPLEGEPTTFGDLVADEKAETFFERAISNGSLEHQITSPLLNDAYKSLTTKQKEIINLAYVEGLNDTEIGLILNKTQQAVSKAHKKALEKLLHYINSHK